jgi:hypothetical protein
MLLKKMTLVQAHIRGKRTNRGGWDSSSPAACIRILRMFCSSLATGIKNPAVALIERVIFAKDRDELVAATKALDRVLLFNHYVVPQWTYGKHRPRPKWDGIAFVFGHRERQSGANGDCIDRAPALAAPAAILSRAILTKADVGDLAAEFTGGGASRRWSLAEKERLLRRCWMLEPGAIPLHTYQMIKILRAALEPFLETSRERFVHHQFSNLPAK